MIVNWNKRSLNLYDWKRYEKDTSINNLAKGTRQWQNFSILFSSEVAVYKMLDKR